MYFCYLRGKLVQIYAGIFLDFVHGFGLYVKGLPKTKRCDSVAVTVSVRIRCICETALKAASDKLKKPDNRSRKEVDNRYFDNSQQLLRSV